jgi:hypothetical protein
VKNLEDKSSNPMVKKIDSELKDITRRLKYSAEEIDSVGAPYYQFIHKNYRNNKTKSF